MGFKKQKARAERKTSPTRVSGRIETTTLSGAMLPSIVLIARGNPLPLPQPDFELTTWTIFEISRLQQRRGLPARRRLLWYRYHQAEVI